MSFIGSVGGSFGAIGGRGRRAVTPMVASGGSEATSGGYKYHVFTSPGNFSVSSVGPGTVEVVLLGGGGGGGNGGDSAAAGGGAGGLVYGSAVPVSATSYPINIGSGGPADSQGGGTSTAFGFTALGGGGGSGRTYPGGSGGNGGGGGSYSGGSASAGPGIQPSQPQPGAATYQIGNDGWGGASPTPPWNWPEFSPAPHIGGSSNPTNDARINPTFPNSSTIISASPVGGLSIGKGAGWRVGEGGASLGGNNFPGGGSYGSGGAGGLGPGAGGSGGICIIRYPS